MKTPSSSGGFLQRGRYPNQILSFEDQTFDVSNVVKIEKNNKKDLPDGELNPGLPRDRRGYSPLYYRGFDED